jgi:hypothetical protein
MVPERESPALQGPHIINRAAWGIPEDAVKIRFFLQGQTLSARGKRNPPAPGIHKSSIIHLKLICQQRKIVFRKVDEAAFMPAAGRTPRTGKFKPLSVKRLIFHRKVSITGFIRKEKVGSPVPTAQFIGYSFCSRHITNSRVDAASPMKPYFSATLGAVKPFFAATLGQRTQRCQERKGKRGKGETGA